MPLSNSLMARKHAHSLLSNLKVRSIEDFECWSKDWSALNKAKRDAMRTVGDLIDQCNDNIDDRKATEIEAASDAVATLVENIDWELDRRTEAGVKTPLGDPKETDYSKVPVVEGRIAPAVDGGSIAVDEEAYALRSDQSMVQWAKTRGAEEYGDLSLGRYLRSMALGGQTDQERRALAEGTDSAGGYTVPTVLSSQLIDALRAASVVRRAGAITVPLTSDNQTIAKVASEPVPDFRLEAAAVAESDPTFTSVSFTPRSMMVMVKCSRELLDDSLNISSALPRMITSAMAAKMDQVALEGSGVAPEPTGLRLQSGIGSTAHNAALTNYAPFITAKTGVETANAGPVNAIIMHPRDAGTLAGLTDTTNQPLNIPPALTGIPMLTTSAIQTDAGSGNNESNIYVGNFRNLMIGLRNDVRVELLRERYAENHQYAFVAHMRFDIAVSHAQSFHKISGVTG